MATVQHTIADFPPQAGPWRVLAEALRVAEHEPLISSLAQHDSARRLWRVVLLKYCLGVPSDTAITCRLAGSPALRHLCGFRWWIPTNGLIGCFTDRLAEHQGQVNMATIQVVRRLATHIDHRTSVWATPAGSVLSVSSSQIDDRFKAHALVDGRYGFPLSMVVMPAEYVDGPMLPVLVDKVRSEHPWIEIDSVLGGHAYDHRENIRYLRRLDIRPIIPAHPTYCRRETADWYFCRAKRFFLLDQPGGVDVGLHVALSVLAYAATVVSGIDLNRVNLAVDTLSTASP